MFVTETFARFADRLRGEPLPAPVIHHAKRAVVDWHAALYPGAVVAPATLLERALAEELDRGGATLALGRRATVRAAALVNGTAAHAIEFDDIFRDAIYHPGAPTIAAALAVAQDRGASGEEFLRAVVAGYEISTRIGAALGRTHYRYWHTTGTVGSFGAAAAAGFLLGLGPAPFAHSLATVATFAAGLQQAFRMDSMSKPLHSGRAAEAGVLAALAAREGVTGSLDVIEGESGLGRAMSDGPDWNRACAGLGEVFNIAAMTFKNHGCCGHTFAAIDGALALKSRAGRPASDIARVRVATYRAALDVAGNREASSAAHAKFSLPYVVAHALAHGSVRLDAFSPERLADPLLRSLMARVEVAVDPEIDAAFPGKRAARVEIDWKDGTSDSWLQPTRKGDPDAPLTDEDLEGKLQELAVPVIGAARAAALSRTLWSLEAVPRLDSALA
ncbi:MAG: MmgE/PrpD family protein [Burkholderiales bacterium]|nr:MmgE/PrpD family protein [Burkholderiales bacterium]